MKGYARVDVSDAIQARKNFLQWFSVLEIRRWRDFREVKNESEAIESLYKATKDDYILVDQTLAAHINKWKNYKIGETKND